MDFVRWDSGITHISSHQIIQKQHQMHVRYTLHYDIWQLFVINQRLLSLWKLGYKLASALQLLWCCLLLLPTKYHLRDPISRPLLFQTHIWSPTPLHFTSHGPCYALLSLLLLALDLCICWEKSTNCSFSKIIILDLCWQIFQRKGKSTDLK